MSNEYMRGDSYVVCARCGIRKRASECKQDWDGLFVCFPDLDEQNPQEYVRGLKNVQRPAVSRPEPPDTFFVTTGTPVGLLLALTVSETPRNLG